MIKDSQRTGVPFHALLDKSVKVFQRVTGNEGPSPMMKRYLKSREKGQLARTIERGSSKTR